MGNDPPEDGRNTEPCADLPTVVERPVERPAGRQAAREGPAADPEGAVAAQPQASMDGAPDLLGEIVDSLLMAYGLARQEGDPLIVALIGKALLHTGRRLAEGMSPSEAGIACH
ncbi:hypothetical protein ACRAWG_03855 [Methylobacterium sp. P31]